MGGDSNRVESMVSRAPKPWIGQWCSPWTYGHASCCCVVSLWTKGAGLNYNLLFAVVWCISNWSLELAQRWSQGVMIRQREFGKPVTQWFQWYSKSQRKRNLAEVNLLSSQLFCFYKNKHVLLEASRTDPLCWEQVALLTGHCDSVGHHGGITGNSGQLVAVASVWGARCCMAAWSWQGRLREVGSQMEMKF